MAECLRRATTVTNEWIYIPTTDGDIRNNLAKRVIKERSVQVELKNLEEVINAQPGAMKVMKSLLDWISRVDLASQHGRPRPAFADAKGEPIFPAQEGQWWLTDFQQKKKPEDIVGDEDGPPTEAEGKENSETDDEDPTSEEDVVGKGHGPNDPTFEPALAQWHRGSA